MDGITLSFTDARPVLAPGALEEQVRAAAPLLAEAAAGEERYRDNLGWHSVDEAAGPERVDFLLEQAARVRADADAFVVIGIGGSNQASRAAVKALRPEGGPAILWAGNTISACEMARTLRELDGYQSICIDCIAKNFETLEPGIAFRVLRQYLERRYGAEGAAKRIFATGTPGSTLHQLCLDQGYTFLTFPETIGGRYSVGSDVGLFPMAVAGVDIRALVQGMRDMRDTLLAAPAEENPALRYACLRRLLLEHGYRLEMLSFFEPRLDYFAKWWIQLFAESEGKEGTALYPVAASNSEDLHSIGQFIQEGSPILFETFVEVRARDASVLLPPEAKKDYFDYLTGMDFWDINNTARQATMRAHGDRGIPCMNLSIPAIDAHTLGGLFYFFLFACYLSCKLLGVNPFNQPGVEGYKGYMFQNLGKLPLLQDGDTTFYLTAFARSDEDPGTLYAVIQPEHQLSREGGQLLLPYRIDEDGGITAQLRVSDLPVQADGEDRPDATRLASQGPGEQFALYVDRALFLRSDAITIQLGSFYRLTYAPA